MSNFAVDEVLEHDHHAIDGQFDLFAEGLTRSEWLTDAFERGAEALCHHIFVEEQVLFPFLRVGGLVAPVFVMLREHAEIWQALQAVESEIRNDFERTRTAMTALGSALEQHNQKEEQVVYPAAAKVLTPADAEDVREAFEQGKRPDSWLPTNLRR